MAANRDYTYDENGFLDTKTDWKGVVTDLDHDVSGNLLSKIKAKGTPVQQLLTFQWDERFNKLKESKSAHKTTTFARYDNSLVRSKTETDLTGTGKSRTWNYTYSFHNNGLINQKIIDGPRNDVSDITTITQNTAGFITKITNPLNQSVTFSNHSVFGKPGLITYQDGRVDRLTYHPRGWLLKSERDIYGDLRKTDYEYTKAGQLKKVTNPEGVSFTFSYDTAHRLTSVKNTKNESIVYSYDNASNLTQESIRHWITTFEICQDSVPTSPFRFPPREEEPGRLCEVDKNETVNATRYTYDALSRLTSVIKGIGTDSSQFGLPFNTSSSGAATVQSFAYDKNNKVSNIKDAKNNSESLQYDELGRISKKIDRNSGITQYWYNSQDLVTKLKDPKGNFTYYTFDGFGNLTDLNSPDTGITQYNYDLANNLVLKNSSNGIASTFQYDSANRLKSEILGTIQRSYTYDTSRKGYLYRVNDESGSRTFTYNAHGELTKKVDSLSGATLTTSWTYNKAGQVVKITHPNGMSVTKTYDDQGKLLGIKSNNRDVIKNSQYKPFGPIKTLQFGSNLTRVYNRDNRYRVTKLLSSNTLSLDYSYDQNGNISLINDGYSTSSKPYRSYYYDKLDRVTSATEYGQSEGFSYDSNGNRISKGTTSYNIANDSNRLLSYTNGKSTSLTYDNVGNVIGLGSATYGYNDANRLSNYSIGSLSAKYIYNGSNQRVKKTVNGVNTWFVYDTDGKLIYERSGSTHKNYIYRLGELVGYTKNNVLYYVHSDNLGRPQVVTDTSNNVKWKAENKAFDRRVVTNTIGGLNLGFPGQYWDSEKASWYNYRRDYDASLGRYLQSDPIGLNDGVNTYSYVHQNPLLYVDPYGEAAVAFVGGWIATDTAVPDPSDAAWPKWVGYGLLLGGAWAVDAIMSDDDTAQSESSEEKCPDNASSSSSDPEQDPDGDDGDDEQRAKDAKRMSKKELNKAARNNGYKDAHEMKRDFQLDSKSDIFVDRYGELYHGPRQGSGIPQRLGININGF